MITINSQKIRTIEQIIKYQSNETNSINIMSDRLIKIIKYVNI